MFIQPARCYALCSHAVGHKIWNISCQNEHILRNCVYRDRIQVVRACYQLRVLVTRYCSTVRCSSVIVLGPRILLTVMTSLHILRLCIACPSNIILLEICNATVVDIPAMFAVSRVKRGRWKWKTWNCRAWKWRTKLHGMKMQYMRLQDTVDTKTETSSS